MKASGSLRTGELCTEAVQVPNTGALDLVPSRGGEAAAEGKEPKTETATAGPAGNGWFETTHWSVVLAAGSESTQAQTALASLCRNYWHPLYCYVRRSGKSPEDAQDLTQEFFARVLAKDYLKRADQGKGRFRSFLLTALKRFLANEWDRASSRKRGGGREVISLDAQDTEQRYLAEPVEAMSPEKVYEQRWVAALLEQVMRRLAAELAENGRAHLFEELKPFLGGDDEQSSYSRISARLGLSEGALRVAVHRLRQRYRELLRLEIANTVQTPEEVDEEIRYLFRAVG